MVKATKSKMRHICNQGFEPCSPALLSSQTEGTSSRTWNQINVSQNARAILPSSHTRLNALIEPMVQGSKGHCSPQSTAESEFGKRHLRRHECIVGQRATSLQFIGGD